jgi:hypothetical protein
LVANYWEAQYPVLNPYSYWAVYHLYDEGFQFDLTRTSNEFGCYAYPHYKSKIVMPPKQLFGRYLTAAIDAVRNNPENAVDLAVRELVAAQAKFFDELSRMLEEEEPTNQMRVEDYVLLGGSSWLRIERDILRDMRAWLGKPACDEHYQNVKLLCDSGLLLFTFRNLVLCTQASANA